MATNDDARVADLLARLGDEGTRDLFRRLLERAVQELIDAELSVAIGARPHERTDSRTNQRDGGRSRLLSAPADDVELRIPKVRIGSFFPSLLEPRRRVEEALWAVDHGRVRERDLDPQGGRPGQGPGVRQRGEPLDGEPNLPGDSSSGRTSWASSPTPPPPSDWLVP